MGDQFLDGKMAQYDEWMRSGRIPHSAGVIPVGLAFSPEQWILPTQQAREILRNSRSFALRDCVCRSHYQRCSSPLSVCLSINDMADRFCASGVARRLTLSDADDILAVANQAGLVHLAVYNPDQYIWGLCSCCSCCCYQLQILFQYGRHDLVVHSDYIAVSDPDQCTGCGLCVERCLFSARSRGDDGIAFQPERCYGCGLCVTTCPERALRLELRPRVTSQHKTYPQP